MKKQVNNKIAVLIISILLVIILVAIYYAKKPESSILDDIKEATKKVVVVKAENGVALVMGEEGDIYRIGIQGHDYKQGNELLVHFNGIILESYPAQFGGKTKVELIKEKSNIEITESALIQCYSSEDNVRVTVSELTNTGISLTIIDANQYPYEYSHNYLINKKVKNKDYTGKGQKIGEDTENSTAGYTRNRARVYLGRSKKGIKHIMSRNRRNIDI